MTVTKLFTLALLTVILGSSCNRKFYRAKQTDGRETTSIRGSVLLKKEGKENKGSLNIKLKEDSILWLSVKGGPGIEAMRLVAKKDSLFLLNRLEKNHVRSSWEEISRITGIPFDFDFLVGFFLGKTSALFHKKIKFKKDKDFPKYSNAFTGSFMENTIKLRTDSTKQYIRELKINKFERELFYLLYKEYEESLDQFCPNKVISSISLKDGAALYIDYSAAQITLENKGFSFPYKVSSKYEEIGIEQLFK